MQIAFSWAELSQLLNNIIIFIYLHIKGCPDHSHLIFEIMSDRGKSDIERLWFLVTSSSFDFESIKKLIILSDIDFKNKMVWAELPLKSRMKILIL